MTNVRQFYDSATLVILRHALDEVLTDRRFLESRSVSALEIAENILAQAARGERDLARIKASAMAYLARVPRRAPPDAALFAKLDAARRFVKK